MARSPAPGPAVAGLHHVTFAVTSLASAIAWYARLLGAVHLPALDHYSDGGEWFAAILTVPGLDFPVQLRVGAPAAVPAGFEPVTFAVADRAALDAWVAHLDACGVPHSPVTSARAGDSVQFASPDGTPLRLYTGRVDLTSPGTLAPAGAAASVS